VGGFSRLVKICEDHTGATKEDSDTGDEEEAEAKVLATNNLQAQARAHKPKDNEGDTEGQPREVLQMNFHWRCNLFLT